MQLGRPVNARAAEAQTIVSYPPCIVWLSGTLQGASLPRRLVWVVCKNVIFVLAWLWSLGQDRCPSRQWNMGQNFRPPRYHKRAKRFVLRQLVHGRCFVREFVTPRRLWGGDQLHVACSYHDLQILHVHKKWIDAGRIMCTKIRFDALGCVTLVGHYNVVPVFQVHRQHGALVNTTTPLHH